MIAVRADCLAGVLRSTTVVDCWNAILHRTITKSHLDSRRTGMDDRKEEFGCQTDALMAFLYARILSLLHLAHNK